VGVGGGVWAFGVGAQTPNTQIPNPQSPIPNLQNSKKFNINNFIIN